MKIDENNSIYEIITKYPETLEILIEMGFKEFNNMNKLKTLGKNINLKMALDMKQIPLNIFLKNLELKINNKKEKEEVINIKGILPCPVKIPILEELNRYIKEKKENFNIDLKTASMGINWLKEDYKISIKNKVPDIFISAGFDLFFNKKTYQNFQDLSNIKNYNKDFQNDEINLKDPKNTYSILAVVPAIFLINKNELKNEIPDSWEDLLSGKYDNKVSLPITDFDLFNAILLNIHKKFGEEGIESLKKTLISNLHPSQMVQSYKTKLNKPAITIMPYFFTKTINKNSPMIPIWPKDGAIISPIFMINKNNNKLKNISEFFASKKIGKIFSYNGKFPSTHPDIDNMITKDNKYLWLGWDYIYNNDLSELIKKLKNIF
ncbi:ABC transporter substrate-binding protein [Oceanotoga sp. DSM 15011]|uniref:ABC transporter substrate-binding protein n=1 Tax=Oceanotoga sp. DSM 15011 TaxID=2984951 RepID=UPI0021F442CA|nr:ABC transporter substrate-binding protein [Oceanotoga sp. DSM 15011]UYP00203.1 ABC transporter substrate-binding protein [Oceanotoga sp. DSM 15011]